MEWAELIKIAGALAVGYCLAILKSKLKKTETLFSLRMAAAKEFSELYRKYNPLNLGELYDGEIRGRKRWGGIRTDISKYQADYEHIFDNKEINDILEKILLSIAEGTNERVDGSEAEDYYKETLINMSKANDMIIQYFLEEGSS